MATTNLAQAMRGKPGLAMGDPNMPRYKLLKEFFAPDDTLYPEGTRLDFDGIPNEWMEPLNEPARKNMQAYLEHLDDCQRAVDAKHNREYRGRLSDLGDILDRVRQDTKAEVEEKARKPIVMPADRGPVPVRGDTVSAQAAKKARSGVKGVQLPSVSRKNKAPTETIGITGRQSAAVAIAQNANETLGTGDDT